MHPFSSPWKHQKTVRFSDVFRGQRKGALGTNGLIINDYVIYRKGFNWVSFPNFRFAKINLKNNLGKKQSLTLSYAKKHITCRECSLSAQFIQKSSPANIYSFKVNNRNLSKRFEVCPKLTTKTPERCQWRSSVFIDIFLTFF